MQPPVVVAPNDSIKTDASVEALHTLHDHDCDVNLLLHALPPSELGRSFGKNMFFKKPKPCLDNILRTMAADSGGRVVQG